MKIRMITGLRLAIAIVCLSSSAQAGLIEICKDALPIGSVTGQFSFTIAGQGGTFTVPAGACTLPFELPNGFADITEVSQPDSILLGVLTFPEDRLVSFDLVTGTARVLVVEGDISNQTVVIFTNTPADTPIPEPATAWLMAAGLSAWALYKKRVKCRSLRPSASLQIRLHGGLKG